MAGTTGGKQTDTLTNLDLSNLDLINLRYAPDPTLQRLTIRQGKITALHPMAEQAQTESSVRSSVQSSVEQWDCAGDWISLGGVDLQINGGLGLAFPEVTEQHMETLEKICQYLWQQGVDGFLPTIVTSSIEQIQRALKVLTEFMQWQAQQFVQNPTQNAAQILGIHLEGPFLNPEKRGAHPLEHLLTLTQENVQRVFGNYASSVKILTLAPELSQTQPGQQSILAQLRERGIVISLGHSQATDAQAQTAFSQGATMVTHAFNAMPGLHHRKPGLLGAALVHPQVCCGFIADGQHVCPTMLDVLIRASRGVNQRLSDIANSPLCSKLFLVSDALAPLGLPDGQYPWDQRWIEITQGTARLEDGTLAGTTLPLLTGVENLVKWGICEVGEAIALATIAPRQALGECKIKGQSAHQLLRWQQTDQGLVWQRLADVYNPDL